MTAGPVVACLVLGLFASPPSIAITAAPAPTHIWTPRRLPTSDCCLPTPTATPGGCVGDCDGDRQVHINELIIGINIALGSAPASLCEGLDCPHIGSLAIPCFVAAVNNALYGCPGNASSTPTPTPTPPSPPELSLVVQVVSFPDESRVEITATISNLGAATVSFVSGCTAQCRPTFHEAILFELTGPGGEDVLIDYACRGPYFCAPTREELPPGSSHTQTLTMTGTALAHHERYPGECFEDCAQTPLADGRYLLVARFEYRIGRDRTDPQGPDVTQSAEFLWPPTAEP